MGSTGALALVLAAALAVTARADDLPDVFATGVDDAGMVLPPGAADPHWDVTSAPVSSFAGPSAAVVARNHPVHLSNDAPGTAGSSWIAMSSSTANSVPSGFYVFETEIDLTGFDPATTLVTGRLAADNWVVDLLVNGTSQGSAGGGFQQWTPLQIDAGFVEGVNTLTFVVRNAGYDPMGLRVELSGTADPIDRAIPVDLIARPGKDASVLTARSHGKLPLAVLSTADFDATTIDPTSVVLSGASVAMRGPKGKKGKKAKKGKKRGKSKKSHKSKKDKGDEDDVAEPRPMASHEDVDGDGRNDLVLHFEWRDLSLSADTTNLELIGLTSEGEQVVGQTPIAVPVD